MTVLRISRRPRSPHGDPLRPQQSSLATHIAVDQISEDRAARSAWIAEHVVGWDEYGQGYDACGRVRVCICGELFAYEKARMGHVCPYDDYDRSKDPEF